MLQIMGKNATVPTRQTHYLAGLHPFRGLHLPRLAWLGRWGFACSRQPVMQSAGNPVCGPRALRV